MSRTRGTDAIRRVGATGLRHAWSEYLDRAAHGHEEIVITRYGKPIAMLVPYRGSDQAEIFGCLAGTVTIRGDVVEGTDVNWNADR